LNVLTWEANEVSTRAKELIAVLCVLVVCAALYIAKLSGWGGLQLSTGVSLVVIGLLALSLIWILIRTVRGHLVDRRVVFLYVGIAVALPFLLNITQKIQISPEVRAVYDDVEQLKPGSKVLVSFDYDPPSAPELQPMAEAFLRQCFERDLKVIIMGLWPQGPQQANLALQTIMQLPEIAKKNLQYGVDYVNLGFQAGNEFVIQRMGADFKSMFPTDVRGVSYDDIPLVKNVKNFSNIDYSFNLSAGYPGTKEWVQVAVDRYGLKLGAGNTAVQAPMIYPYYRAGQLRGVLGGMNGGAEYELLTDYAGKATTFMNSQSFAHVVVIAFIIIGNAAYFTDRWRKQKRVNQS
jgi:hypothetical protein